MEKIAVKTKINFLTFAGETEKIGFNVLDFAPDQVAAIDRLIRNNKEDPVRLTIEPENKQLQYAPIVSHVRLVSMNCMGTGQKIKIADFKSTDDRATTLKRLVTSGTQVVVTIEPVQGRMFDETKASDERRVTSDNYPCAELKGADDIEDADLSDIDDEDRETQNSKLGTQNSVNDKGEEVKVNESGVITNPTVIKVSFPKTYRTKCQINIANWEGGWFYGYNIDIPNRGCGRPIVVSDGKYESSASALAAAVLDIGRWFDDDKKYKYHKPAKKKIEKVINDWLFEHA